MTDKTHFGFRQVDKNSKQDLVADVFDTVAKKYDIMNDVMSLGLHRLWKNHAVAHAHIRPEMTILDLASGTCDLALRMAKILAGTGRLVAADINQSMLNIGKDRMTNRGLVKNIEFQLANAEELPFEENTFDLVTMAFGLRNVTDQQQALKEIYRVLKVGGKCLVLEFSKPVLRPLEVVYDYYSFNIIPKMGQIIADEIDSYRYLAESIRMHPDQDTLQAMFRTAGFAITWYDNLAGGIVALHQGIRI